MANVVNASATPTLSITVTFDDGSKIKGFYNPSTGELQANPDTAQDAEGNPIPYMDSDGKLHKLAGRRQFSDDYQGVKDYELFVQQLRDASRTRGVGGRAGLRAWKFPSHYLRRDTQRRWLEDDDLLPRLSRMSLRCRRCSTALASTPFPLQSERQGRRVRIPGDPIWQQSKIVHNVGFERTCRLSSVIAVRDNYDRAASRAGG